MKKILCLTLIILVIGISFVACGSKKDISGAQTSTQSSENSIIDSTSVPVSEKEPDTKPQLKGFTIEELQNSVITTLQSKDDKIISEYMLPGCNSAIRYAYENFDYDTSAIVDLEALTMSELFSKGAKEGINYGDKAKYTAEDLIVLSEINDEEDREEYESILTDIKRCLKASKSTIEITDLAVFEIVAESDEYSLGISVVTVKVNDDWYIFAFDY